ncbi:hypothetical protein [Rhizobium leguminosarum]|uniref:hypothetical protein n=1 Tax=Rhizobium leguminosarum TaxID=384 RepID=UPI000FEC4462|nr:hypothetical protein [Rhizobium leguminosarum]RWX35249.1 hypothetical protein EHI43_11455 [Rhizobium leguminosarum]
MKLNLSMRIFMRVFGRVLVDLIAAILLFFLIGFDGFFIAAQAEASAGERPYCIGTAEPKNAGVYLPVTKIEDVEPQGAAGVGQASFGISHAICLRENKDP